MLPKILVTPFGGNASTLFIKKWRRRIHPRPDYPFSPAIDPYDIHSYANWDGLQMHEHVGYDRPLPLKRYREWQKRAGFDPDPYKTIHEHLMMLINTTPNHILLFGKCSLEETWLTNNKIIDALFMVRNPIDAYDSFFGRRHPQWSDRVGGIESLTSAQYYCDQWNKVVYDFVCSNQEYGTPLVRYEFLIEDLEAAGLRELARFLKPLWYNKPKREFITPLVQECIEDLTHEHCSKIYNGRKR